MQDFKKLHVWRKSHSLALRIHRVAGRVRGSQYASLRSQMVRAAMSVPANIVEGRAQKNERDFIRFLRYSLASSAELEYHVIVARDFQKITEQESASIIADVIEIRKMLHGLLGRLNLPASSSEAM